MFNSNTILAIGVLALAVIVIAEPVQRRANIRFLARQEAEAPAADAAAAPPYPPAGVTPEVPFDLPTENEPTPAAQPDQTYGPPDPTYGPPPSQPDNTYGPPPSQPDNTYGPPPSQPDNTYGPPQAAGAAGEPAIEEPDAEEVVSADAGNYVIAQSFVQPRNKGAVSIVPIRLSTAPAPIPQPVGVVEIIRSEPVIVYTLK